MMRPLRYLSVCSGIEAVSVAWQPLRWHAAMFAEVDPFCCWLLRSRYRATRPLHMPSPHDAPDRKEAKRRAAAIRNVVALPTAGEIINAGDFTRIGGEYAGTVDVLAGGTPCQSFSVAGRRAGLDDPRGNLTIEFARLADRIRPTWLVWENVPGVLSIDGGRTFGAFLGLLVQLGYGVAYRVLDAQFFGVPQRRRRVFVIGCLGNWRAAAAVLSEYHCLSGYPPPRRSARQGVAIGVEVGPAGSRFTDAAPTLDTGCKDGFVRNQLGVGVLSSTEDISYCLNAGGMGRQDAESETLIAHTLLAKENDSRDAGRQTYIAHALSADGFDASEDGTGRGTPLVPVAICTAHTQSNGSGFSEDVAHTLESGSATQAVAFAQNSRDELRLFGGDGQKVGALAAQAGTKQQSYIAFSAKDHGADAGDIAPTLRSMGDAGGGANGGGQVAVAFAQSQGGEVRSSDVMHSLNTNTNATSRNAPTVAFTLHGSDGNASAASSTDTAGSLRTRAPGSIENSSTTAVLQQQLGDTAATSQPPMVVRRLTPRECERLQGFPDDYTLIEYRGKLACDGPRYKALGNSMAVPVMRWLGERIAQVDVILAESAVQSSQRKPNASVSAEDISPKEKHHAVA